MFKNYFKTACRNLKRNKFFSLINIIGLAMGLTCFLLICSYLFTELTYDRYAKEANRIYRVDLNALGVHYPDVDGPVGAGIKNAFPQVLSFTRLANEPDQYVRYKTNQFKEENIAQVDANFLQLFSIPLLEGNEKNALERPQSIVITKAFAEKYFGRENPIGKALIFGKNTTYYVTGVIDKIPERSHFHFDAFISISSFPWRMNTATWSNLGYYTYILLAKNANPKALEKKFPKLVSEHVVPEIEQGIQNITDPDQKRKLITEAKKAIRSFSFSLTPITRIHLYSHTKYELEPNGDIKYVYIFASLALFILLLACMNFINLSTAASFGRAREVGVRKTLGALKRQLIWQFLIEAILITTCAVILSLLMLSLLWPYFSHLSGSNLPLTMLLSGKAIASIFILMLAVAVISGIYPAFFLSAFKPVKVLKGSLSLASGNKRGIRSALVVFQFVVSICLIIATLIIYKQLYFMQNKKLGFDKDQLLIIQDTYRLGTNESAFRQQLLRNPMIVNATISRDVPGRKESVLGRTMAYPQDQAESKTADRIPIHIFNIDNNYIPTMGIKLVSGRNFSPDFPSDSLAMVINQATAKVMGWSHTNPVGKYIVVSNGTKYKVIGVVKDFNYLSVQQEIAPLVMKLGRNSGTIMARIRTTNIPALLRGIQKEWNSFHPAASFSYDFVDSRLAILYVSERKTGQLFIGFTVMAVMITCLGLFGLVTFMAYQRIKEIGIRKTLGASVASVVMLLSKDFLKLVITAAILAAPIAWLAMNRWLQNFAYRVNISWWIFVVAGMLAVVIAIITVSWQAIRAARANPVNSLRAE